MNYGVFRSNDRTIVRVKVRVIPLIPDCLASIRYRANDRNNVALITSTFLRLPRFTMNSTLINFGMEGGIPGVFYRSFVGGGDVKLFLRATGLIMFMRESALVVSRCVITWGASTRCNRHIARSPVKPMVSQAVSDVSVSNSQFVYEIFPDAIASTRRSSAEKVPCVRRPTFRHFGVFYQPAFVIACRFYYINRDVSVRSYDRNVVKIPSGMFHNDDPNIRGLSHVLNVYFQAICSPT